MQVIKYAFQQHGDERGQLVALEEFKDIPFKIISLHMASLMAQPSSLFHYLNEFYSFHEYKSKREMFDFSSDAVLMVLASELYDESDYIRDYDEFLKFVNSKDGVKK